MKNEPQNVIKDSKYLEKEKYQLTKFFRDIARCVAGVNDIVIFGPAQTGEKLYNQLMEKDNKFNPKTIAIKPANNMTDSEIMAWVKNYYNSGNKPIVQ